MGSLIDINKLWISANQKEFVLYEPIRARMNLVIDLNIILFSYLECKDF